MTRHSLELEKLVIADVTMLKKLQGQKVFFKSKSNACNFSKGTVGVAGSTLLEMVDVEHYNLDLDSYLNPGIEIFRSPSGVATKELYNYREDISYIVGVDDLKHG